MAVNATTELEQDARDRIVSLAKDNHMYFVVVWSGNFGRYFVALKNKSGLAYNIYNAIYESYYDLVGDNDEEVVRFENPDMFTWRELLLIVKAHLPRKLM